MRPKKNPQPSQKNAISRSQKVKSRYKRNLNSEAKFGSLESDYCSDAFDDINFESAPTYALRIAAPKP